MSSQAEGGGIDPMRRRGGPMESLRVVGTVILEALPAIETELARRAR